ncbi:tetratricopeptide repeat protein [Pseudomonas sp. GCM10022188]|uniref:tetratricopeptide repeat protein n=1 Tax=Pseudomonas TaxID=286 RepID=UPI001E348721|nr:tetratricopeptide repeat protein [Pseudomonas oryzagri]MCC6077589.1 tetratricopeptide repeat protein [Pseudomonas oryzagri]
MSLVNDMLRDLESRQAPAAERAALGGLQAVDEDAAARRAGRRRLWLLLPGLGLVLAAGLLVRQLPAPAQPAGDSVAAVPQAAEPAPQLAPPPAAAPAEIQLLATLPQQSEQRFVLQLLLDRAPEYRRSEQSGVVSLRLPHLRLTDDGPRAGRLAHAGRSLSWSLQPLADGAELLLVGLGDDLQVRDRLEPAGERWQLWVEVPLAAGTADDFDPAELPVAGATERGARPAKKESEPASAAPAEPLQDARPVAAASAPVVPAARPASAAAPQLSVASHRPEPLAEARQALLAGERARAIGLLEELKRSQPDNREALHWLARAWLADGQGERLLAELPAQVARFPADSELRVLLARAQLQAGDHAAAVATLAERLPPLAGDPAYHALLAACYQQTGQWQDSARLYRDLVLLRPEQASWQLGLGIALERLGERAAAAQHYRLALQGRGLDDASRRYAEERAQTQGGQS